MSGASDDLTIDDETILWRRIPPEWVVYETDGESRPSSAAFDDSTKPPSPMSVVISRESRDPREVLEGYEQYALAGFTAGIARENGQSIQRDPIINDPVLPDEPDHALVAGNKSKSIKKKLAKAATWVIPPG